MGRWHSCYKSAKGPPDIWLRIPRVKRCYADPTPAGLRKPATEQSVGCWHLKLMVDRSQDEAPRYGIAMSKPTLAPSDCSCPLLKE
jgi:hypothetical protein